MSFQASPELVRKAARDAIKRAKCDLKEDRKIDEGTYMLIGSSSMHLVTIMPTFGVWVRIFIARQDSGKTAVRYFIQKRDPNDHVFNQEASLETNIPLYLSGNVEELLLDQSQSVSDKP